MKYNYTGRTLSTVCSQPLLKYRIDLKYKTSCLQDRPRPVHHLLLHEMAVVFCTQKAKILTIFAVIFNVQSRLTGNISLTSFCYYAWNAQVYGDDDVAALSELSLQDIWIFQELLEIRYPALSAWRSCPVLYFPL